MYLILFFIGIVLSAFLIWASADVGSGVYMRCLCKGKTDQKVVALTFDDGPELGRTDRILDILQRYGIKATFFVIGSKVACHLETVARINREGHTIGNHTYSHKGGWMMKPFRQAREDVERCNREIEGITAKRPFLCRPPFGVTNPIVAAAFKGMVAVGWSIRSLDTLTCLSREWVCRRILSRIHPGAVILLHDRCKDSDILLEMLLVEMGKRGYRVIPLVEFFNCEDND